MMAVQSGHPSLVTFPAKNSLQRYGWYGFTP